MKQGMGKSKGSGFEREVCRYLTKWISGVETPYIFYRSPSSGAVSTITKSNNISGDVISVKPEADFFLDVFSIEVKTGYPKADFFQHFKEVKNNVIKDFWLQCLNDAEKAHKYGMLIFKKKGLKPIVGIDNIIRDKLKYEIKLPKSLKLTFDDGTFPINFFDMEEFFDIVTPEIIKKINVGR